jgi:hypothetical protein
MTLKTDYTGTLTSALDAAFAAGNTFISPTLPINTNANYTTLSAALITAANSGQNTFTVFIATSYLPEALKLNGNLLKAYLAGIYAGLAAQGIYHTYEVALSLDTSTVGTNKIKFNFTFNP